MNRQQPIWKKTAAATLALSMIAGAATSVVASADSGHKNEHRQKQSDKKKQKKINLNFNDLDEQDWKWAYEHIIRLASQGVFNGYEDGSFKPRNNITRIEALVAAVRLLGLQAEAEKAENMNANLNFKDFNQLKKKYPWAVGYVTVALENDLFSENDTVIQAEKPADRLWAAVLLVKAMKLEAEAKASMDAQLSFRDAHQIPAGSVGYVAVAVEKKLITGYGDGTFRPNKPVTRAELAALLDRVDEQLPDEDGAMAITGTIQAIAGGSVTVKRADNTSVTVKLADGVFIFRDDVKAPVSALKPGDEVLVRTYEGEAVFIEVTKEVVDTTTDSGQARAYTLNASGKLATITIVKQVGGLEHIAIYNVASDVVITGNNGILELNKNVEVKLQANVVTHIDIKS